MASEMHAMDMATARQLMNYADQIRRLARVGYDGADDAEAIAAALERQARRLVPAE